MNPTPYSTYTVTDHGRFQTEHIPPGEAFPSGPAGFLLVALWVAVIVLRPRKAQR